MPMPRARVRRPRGVKAPAVACPELHGNLNTGLIGVLGIGQAQFGITAVEEHSYHRAKFRRNLLESRIKVLANSATELPLDFVEVLSGSFQIGNLLAKEGRALLK